MVIRRILKDNFIRNNVIVFAGNMTAAFLNYLAHPILSRIMTVDDFGEVQTLLSLFSNLMFLGVFGTVVLNIVANSDPSEQSTADESMAVITSLRKIAGTLALVASLAIAVGSFWLRDFFHFDSYWPFLALAPASLISVNIVFRKAYLRGTYRFKSWAIYDVLISSSRFVFTVLLVWLGWRSFGATIGLILSMLIGLGFVYAQSRKGFRYVRGLKVKLDGRLKREAKFGLLILSVSFIMTAMSTIDVLIVKHYFAPVLAGEYGAAATIARIVLYVTGPVAVVLTPYIKINRSSKENHAVLRKALTLTAVLSGSAFAVFVAWPNFVLMLMMGARYESAAFLLPTLAVLMIMIAVMNAMYSYHLALRHNFIGPIGIIGLATVLILSWLNHSTLLAVVHNSMAGVGIILSLFAIHWVRQHFLTKAYVESV